MQQFASAAKKHLAKLIIVAKSFFNAAKGFCTNVIPFIVSKIVSYLKKSPFLNRHFLMNGAVRK